MFLAHGAKRVAILVSSLVLARILTPEDFGLVAMAMVVVGFVELLRDLGTGAALIQRIELTDELIASVFWVNLVFGLGMGVLLYAAAPYIAALYREARVAAILNWLALSPVLSSLQVVPASLLMRRMEFRAVAIVEMISVALATFWAIALAINGYGIWSLVQQTLVLSGLTAVGVWWSSGWRPRAAFRLTEVKAITGYSLNLAGFNLLNYFSRQADNFLIGRYLGSQPLGYYDLAYRVMLSPLQAFSWTMMRVLFPVYSGLQDDLPRFRRIYLRTAGAIALFTFPLMFGLAALADPFVLVVFGQEWLAIAPLLTILAPLGALQSLMTTVGPIYQAKGRTDLLFRWGIGAGAITVASFVVGLPWGVVGVAGSYAIACGLLAYPNFAIPFRLIDLPVRDLWHAVRRTWFCSVGMTVAVIALRVVLDGVLATPQLLLTCVAFGIAVYWGLTRALNYDELRDVVGALRERIG